MSITPNLVYADEKGEIVSHPFLKMSVRAGSYDMVPYDTELIPLPNSSRLYFLPDTYPIAYDERKANMVEFEGGMAASVFLPPAYLRLLLPSYKKTKEYTMPLFAYTAVGEVNGELVVPAIKVDDDKRWAPHLYDFSEKFDERVEEFLKNAPKGNRLYDQLKQCATVYHCTAAKNIFYPRWECPIPTSPTCNASCVGCISLQESECCPSPQDRIKFAPTAAEIAEVALYHNSLADDPIISFGQGCEGDPIMQADTIAEAIKIIKKTAPTLTVNFNSNASLPKAVEKILEAGADSVRVSTNSFVSATYNSYYRPRGYTLEDVIKSIELVSSAKRYLQLNLLICPGVNDRKSETDKLIEIVEKYKVDLIQTRNLNIDVDLLLSQVKTKPEEIYGIKNMLKLIKKSRPEILFGYFNRMKKEFHLDRGFPDLRVKKVKHSD